MAKKTKAKNEKKNTKEEKFSFDEEIIIGLRRIENEKVSQNKNSKKKGKMRNDVKVQANQKKREAEEDKLASIPQRIGEAKNSKEKRKGVAAQKKKVQKKLTPKQELARKKRKAIFRITKWLMLFAIIIGGGIYALLSPIFNIKKIDVVGNSKIATEEIISLSGIELEQNMFQYRNKDMIKNVKQNAYMDTVKVKRKIPNTIEITVTERKTSFMIQVANAYAYISNQGYILEISNQKLDFPILTGIKTEQENIQDGSRLCNEDLKKLGDVLQIMEAATSNELANLITTIDITDDENYILIMQTKKKTIYLGDISNLSTKMLWILTFNEKEGNTRGDILLNMNLDEGKNKPVFRKKI